MSTAATRLVGTLTGVSASWVRSPVGDRARSPLHIWLTVDGLGTRKVHTSGNGSLVILDEPLLPAYAMGELGSVEVDSGSPPVLAAMLGRRISTASPLRQDPPGMEVGFVLHFRGAEVGIANLGDELEVAMWPHDTWVQRGVSVVEQ